MTSSSIDTQRLVKAKYCLSFVRSFYFVIHCICLHKKLWTDWPRRRIGFHQWII